MFQWEQEDQVQVFFLTSVLCSVDSSKFLKIEDQ